MLDQVLSQTPLTSESYKDSHVVDKPLGRGGGEAPGVSDNDGVRFNEADAGDESKDGEEYEDEGNEDAMHACPIDVVDGHACLVN